VRRRGNELMGLLWPAPARMRGGVQRWRDPGCDATVGQCRVGRLGVIGLGLRLTEVVGHKFI
jgi:hypothetical protein